MENCKQRIIFEINELARTCGCFFNACLTENFEFNNGYNCRHPQQKQTETNPETGYEVGGCFAWSCPLGYEADEEDFQNKEINRNGWEEWEDGQFVVVDQEDHQGVNPSELPVGETILEKR